MPIINSTTTDIALRGKRLRVAVRAANGAGPPRPPLLLLSGLGARLEVLDPLVEQLPPELEIIRLDVPGVGASPAPALPYHYARLASLIAALLTTLGHDRVDVLGYSWGGGLAQQFALTQARHCRRLVLAATATGALMVPARPHVLARMLTPRRHRDPAYARRIAGQLYGGSMRTHPERAGQALRAHARSGSTRGYLYNCSPSAAGPAWPSSSSSDSPHSYWRPTTTHSSRPSTRGSSLAPSRTPDCTSTAAATSPS